MAVEFNFINAKKNKFMHRSILLTLCLILILGSVFFVKKRQIAENAKLNNQSISLAINSTESKPVIAIVISAIGSLKLDADLPKEITIGIPSYIDLEDENKLLGYNIALNISLESNDDQENIVKLNDILSKKFNYQALYTNADENYTNSYSKAEYLLKLLQSKKIIYLSGVIDKDAIIYDIANKLDYLILKNDIILDEEISSEHIIKQLLELENISKESGFAIAMGSAYPLTLKLLKEWTATLSDKDIRLVSIKDFYNIYANRQLSAKNDN